MGKLTQLHQGSLNGLRRQTNECLDNAYNKGFEDGNKIADKDLKEIQDSTYDVAYNKALKDVNHAMDVLEDMTVAEVKEWFKDCIGIDDAVCTFTIQEIVRRTKAYEEKKKAEKEIKVGDEVTVTDSDALVGYTFIVMQIIEKRVVGIRDDWRLYENLNLEYLEKTGRHFDEVGQLLDKLRKEHAVCGKDLSNVYD